MLFLKRLPYPLFRSLLLQRHGATAKPHKPLPTGGCQGVKEWNLGQLTDYYVEGCNERNEHVECKGQLRDY